MAHNLADVATIPSVRRLVPADAAAHRALMLEAYRDAADAFTSTVAEREPLPLAWWAARMAEGAGIGRRLVHAIVAGARRRPGLRVLQLEASAGNAAALSLYQRCGFVAWGTEPMAVRSGDVTIDEVHLWLPLVPPSP